MFLGVEPQHHFQALLSVFSVLGWAGGGGPYLTHTIATFLSATGGHRSMLTTHTNAHASQQDPTLLTDRKLYGLEDYSIRTLPACVHL